MFHTYVHSNLPFIVVKIFGLCLYSCTKIKYIGTPDKIMLNATIECTGSLTIGKKINNIATKIIVFGMKVKTYGKTYTRVLLINLQE